MADSAFVRARAGDMSAFGAGPRSRIGASRVPPARMRQRRQPSDPSTSSIVYRPGGRPATQRAATSAPRAKPERSCAWWASSTVSPAPAKINRWSPTMSPPRTTLKPMRPRSRMPVLPCRAKSATSSRSDAPAAARPRARARAPSRSARRPCCDDVPRRSRRRMRRPSARAASSASLNSTLTPRLMLGASTIGMPRGELGRAPRAAASLCPVVPITSAQPALATEPRR